eukprot:1160942-Pelagomonas_calceolata.AAC.3
MKGVRHLMCVFLPALHHAGEIEQSEVDGKAVGQLRVWPGGLAMTRSIGDYEAGEPVIGCGMPCVHACGQSVLTGGSEANLRASLFP